MLLKNHLTTDLLPATLNTDNTSNTTNMENTNVIC